MALWYLLSALLPLRPWVAALAAVCLWSASAAAEPATVAVAANFKPTLERLAARFEADTGHRIRISSASTGMLYAQIINGARFDLFLAADSDRPQRLEREGHAVADSRFTYARGQLVLLRAPRLENEQAPEDIAAVLRSAAPRSVALANPATAPYGLAARQVYEHLGLWERAAATRVQGNNVAQAFQFVATGAARWGFVSLAQIRTAPGDTDWSYLAVPEHWHKPIDQQAVLLKHGADNPAARAFHRFLTSEPARALIAADGYGG